MENELKKVFIDEKEYQEIKTVMNKKNDIFTQNEHRILTNIYRNSGEI